ncbi:MAG: large-conductance mechanosensitive channel protein MscL [Sphingobacteriales bacterium]|nr:large-conductance mechanosensitive channel protein MscL [Sphingobacteriales bacterium]
MGLIQEYKDFIAKGNVIDLAVGVVIGGAFGKIVGSVVDDLIMPPVGMLLGNDFSAMKLTLKNAVMEGEKIISPEIAIKYGNFITVLIQFLIIAFVLFLVVKAYNNMKKAEAAAPAPPPASEVLLTEIRDLLKR